MQGRMTYKVDYYAILTKSHVGAYRNGLEYMDHIVGDPLFHGQNLSSVARDAVAATGATLRAFMVLPQAVPIDNETLKRKWEFPSFDTRNRRRTRFGNHNMLRLFDNLQYLWDTQLRQWNGHTEDTTML